MSKRTCLTLDQKLQIKEYASRHPKATQIDIAAWAEKTFSVTIGRTTVQKIITTPFQSFIAGNLQQKKRRRVQFPEFEKELVEFVIQHESTVPLSDAIIIEKGHRIAEKHGVSLKLSNGWITKFKQRNGIRQQRLHGEEGSVDLFHYEEEQRKL